MKDNNLLPIGNEEAATLFLNYVLQRQNGTYEKQLKRFAEGKHNSLAKVEALQKAALSSVPSPFNDLIEFLDILSKDTVSGHFGGRLSAVVESLKPVGEIPNLRFEEVDVRIKQSTAGEAKELALCLLVLLTTEKRKEIFEVLKLSLQNGGEENFYLEEWTQPQIIELQGLYQALKEKATHKVAEQTSRLLGDDFMTMLATDFPKLQNYLSVKDRDNKGRVVWEEMIKDLAFIISKLPERVNRYEFYGLFFVKANGTAMNSKSLKTLASHVNNDREPIEASSHIIKLFDKS